MAQLIKLKDCVSRYERDPYHYSAQFNRLKHDNWQGLYNRWQAERSEIDKHDIVESEFSTDSFIKDNDLDEPLFSDTPSLPKTKLQLKQYFLDNLLPIQLKWATSTLTELSYTDKRYDLDPDLKYFLQRFPDIYLLMYYPVFNIRKAPIDGEIILISPLEIEIIHLVEKQSETTIMLGDERTWTIEKPSGEISKIISPLIALKRTEHIISGILHKHDIDFPIKKTVLSRKNPILFASEPYQTQVIGKHEYKQWFQNKRALRISLKSTQLKAMGAILKYCQTTSIKRPEWKEPTHIQMIEDHNN